MWFDCLWEEKNRRQKKTLLRTVYNRVTQPWGCELGAPATEKLCPNQWDAGMQEGGDAKGRVRSSHGGGSAEQLQDRSRCSLKGLGHQKATGDGCAPSQLQPGQPPCPPRKPTPPTKLRYFFITYNNHSSIKPSISENISTATEVKSFLSIRTWKYMRQTVSWHKAAEMNTLGHSNADWHQPEIQLHWLAAHEEDYIKKGF